MLNRLEFISVLALIAFPNAISRAAIISTSGAVVVVPHMDSVVNGAHESDTQIRVFPESQNRILPTAVTADISLPGTTPTATSDNFSPITLPAGTLVDTWYLHFDNVGTPDSDHAIPLSGSITFDTEILGIVITTANLTITDAVLGIPTTIYSTVAGRELEIVPGGSGQLANDDITLSADRRTASFDLRTSSNPDDVRFITAVPEPATLLMLAAALPLVLSRRKPTAPRM